ncbi:MAG: methionyl-tRNA formyltransferase [Burkholderiaceae bacterium]|nr:MAG: methionyl-tRNA formyltransferase [Burkholderiaceae bacterium]
MKLVFAGTPEFAAVAMQALIDAGHEIVLVLTQPDRPAGRGMKLQASAVKQLALAHGVPVAQPMSLRLDGKHPQDAADAREALMACGAEAMIVAAYGLILPQWVLDLPARGCLNIHASLLPRWRGAAPIHRAIEAGDAETGVTIMQMDAGLDTGAMRLVGRMSIEAHDTTSSLHDKLAAQGGQLMVQALADIEAGLSQAVPQPEEGVTYAHKIEKAEALICWAQSAQEIARRVRAFDPFPGAATQWGELAVKCWAAQAEDTAPGAPAGTVLQADDSGVRVACGQGVLRVTALQRPGGKRLDAKAFLAGQDLPVGTVLG